MLRRLDFSRQKARPYHPTFAAYCQAYSQWVDAVEKQRGSPKLIKTPSGHVQQSPLIGIANKQLELMGRYMAELGLTPSARSRIAPPDETERAESAMTITRVIIGGPDDFADEPIEGARGRHPALNKSRSGSEI